MHRKRRKFNEITKMRESLRQHMSKTTIFLMFFSYKYRDREKLTTQGEHLFILCFWNVVGQNIILEK